MTPAPAALQGVLSPGLGEAAGFTRIGWVRQAFIDHLGIDPHPGTVNLAVPPDQAAAWRAWRQTAGVLIPAGQPGFCDATAWHAAVQAGDGRTAAAAVLLPHVPDYPEDKIELISALPLRETLGVGDGDVVSIVLHPRNDP